MSENHSQTPKKRQAKYERKNTSSGGTKKRKRDEFEEQEDLEDVSNIYDVIQEPDWLSRKMAKNENSNRIELLEKMLKEF